MNAAVGSPPLSSARLIGVLGDTHSDMQHVLTMSDTMWTRGVSVVLVPGDFGFVWPGPDWSIDLDKLTRLLAAPGQTIFVDGNYEFFPALQRFR